MKYFFTAALGLFLYSAAFSQTCNCTGTDINLYNLSTENFQVDLYVETINTSGCPAPTGGPALCKTIFLSAGSNVCADTSTCGPGTNFSHMVVTARDAINVLNPCSPLKTGMTASISFSPTGTFGVPVDGCSGSTWSIDLWGCHQCGNGDDDFSDNLILSIY